MFLSNIGNQERIDSRKTGETGLNGCRFPKQIVRFGFMKFGNSLYE